MKQVKKNKQKVWRKTYGKRFLARKALVIASMARDAAIASSEINVIMHASTDKFQKGIAIATKLITQATHMANQSKLLNRGFINNEQTNKKD